MNILLYIAVLPVFGLLYFIYKKDKHPCDFDPKFGTNIVNVHTQKGLNLFTSIRSDLNILYEV